MTQRPRSLTDRLVLRGWVTPDAEQPVRVLISHQRANDLELEEQGFSDPERAGAFVTTWLRGLLARWEQGERSPGPPPPHLRRHGERPREE